MTFTVRTRPPHPTVRPAVLLLGLLRPVSVCYGLDLKSDDALLFLAVLSQG